MAQARLLLVEDDSSLGLTLKERLEREQFQVTWEDKLEGALRHEWDQFDLAILDVRLPDGSGFDLARKIKANSGLPIIFVSAHGDAPFRLQGYEIGAEEYIPKPFHLKELLLRVRHVLNNHSLNRTVNVNGRVISFKSRQIIAADGAKESLAQKDFEILKLLIDRTPAVVSRDDILNVVWGEEKFPSTRTVDNVIVRLRSLLGDEDGQIIKSVRGVGYQWMGDRS